MTEPDAVTEEEALMRNIRLRWYIRVLRNARHGTYHFIYIHRGALEDEVLRRYFLDQVRQEVADAWGEHYPDRQHGRVFWKYEPTQEVRSAVRLSAILLPEGEHPDQVDHDRRTA